MGSITTITSESFAISSAGAAAMHTEDVKMLNVTTAASVAVLNAWLTIGWITVFALRSLLLNLNVKPARGMRQAFRGITALEKALTDSATHKALAASITHA
jgi:hypothetical protein